MATAKLVNSISANGTATPATASLTGVTAGNSLYCLIGCVGSTATSLATPTGDSWQSIQNVSGSGSGVPSFAFFFLPNAGAGTHTPSSVLTGTITGWFCEVFEFAGLGVPVTGFPAGSNAVTGSTAAVTNAFNSGSPQIIPTLVMMYALLRQTATVSNPVSGLPMQAPPGYSGQSVWQGSILPQAGVNGLSLDFYWASGQQCWPCAYPTTTGTLSGAVNWVGIAVWIAGQTVTIPDGRSVAEGGSYVGPFFSGMIGG